MICKEREYNQQRKRTRPNRKCRKCIRANAQKVKKDAQLKNRVTSHVKMKQSEFIKLGKAYFWHFDWIDPFTGNIHKLMNEIIDKDYCCSHLSGSLFDKPVTGGEVGELNANIIGRQFRSLKFGDRFFFSHRRTSTVPGLHPTLRQNIFKYFSGFFNHETFKCTLHLDAPCLACCVIICHLRPPRKRLLSYRNKLSPSPKKEHGKLVKTFFPKLP